MLTACTSFKNQLQTSCTDTCSSSRSDSDHDHEPMGMSYVLWYIELKNIYMYDRQGCH